MVLQLLSKRMFIIKYLLGILTGVVLSIMLSGITFYNVKAYIKNSYLTNIDSMVTHNGIDLSLFCNITNCKYIIYDNCLFKPNKNGILEEDTSCKVNNGETTYNIDDSLDFFVIKIKPKHELLKNRLEIGTVVEFSGTFINNIIICMIVFFIWYTYTYIYTAMLEYKNDKYDRDLLHSETDNKNKLQLTESIYHDFLGPINVIKILSKHLLEAYNNMTTKELLDSDRCAHELKTIINITGKLEDILYTIKRTRNYRVNGTGTGLIDILNNTVEMFNVGAISNRIKYKPIFTKDMHDIILDDMYDGEFMNIIQHMLGNSVDAETRHIEISGKMLDKNTIELTYRDDGTGIIDRNGNMIKSQDYEKLFTEGISTKSELEHKNGSLSYKFSVFIDKLFNIEALSTSTERGIGLHTVRQTLTKHNGTVRIDRSSSNGTVFILTLKVRVVDKK